MKKCAFEKERPVEEGRDYSMEGCLDENGEDVIQLERITTISWISMPMVDWHFQ